MSVKVAFRPEMKSKQYFDLIQGDWMPLLLTDTAKSGKKPLINGHSLQP